MKLVFKKGICKNGLLVKELEFPHNSSSLYLDDVDVVIITPRILNNKLVSFVESLKSEGKIVIGKGIMNKVNRFFLERTSIDILLDPHASDVVKRYDFLHHFNSGLNHVLVDIAKRKGMAFFFSMNFLLSENDFLIAREIGRINQNIFLCRKKGVPFILDFLVSTPDLIYSDRELRSLYSFFNISTIQKKLALSYLSKIFYERSLEAKGVSIYKGISIVEE